MNITFVTNPPVPVKPEVTKIILELDPKEFNDLQKLCNGNRRNPTLHSYLDAVTKPDGSKWFTTDIFGLMDKIRNATPEIV